MKLRFLKPLLLFFSSITFFWSFGQNAVYDFKKLTTDDGLSNGTVVAIQVDQRGFAWFGTDEGLNRYDGYKFTTYKTGTGDTTELFGNYIQKIVEDQEGLIYIGTNEGLNIFDWKTEQINVHVHSTTNQKSISKGGVRDILIDSQQRIWISTWNGFCLYSKKDKSFTTINFKGTDNDFVITKMVESPDGNLWMSTNAGAVVKFDTNTYNTTFYKFSESKVSSNAVFYEKKGILWVATSGMGLLMLDVVSGNFSRYESKEYPIIVNNVDVLEEDSNGNLWIAINGFGVICHNLYSQKDVHLKYDEFSPKSLSSNVIFSIHCDQAGNIWIGTYKTGINLYAKAQNKFSTHIKHPGKNSLNHNLVRSFLEDTDGMIWIGTDGGGLDKYNPFSDTFTHFVSDNKTPNTIAANAVLCTYQDKTGMIWIGMWEGGLARLDPKTGKIKSYKNDPNNLASIGENHVWSICEDSFGNFWVGTYTNGLQLMDRKAETFIRMTHNPNIQSGISKGAVQAIVDDGRGNLWLGTTSGANKMNIQTRKFQNFTNSSMEETIEGGIIYTIFKDKKNELWIGSHLGLCRYNYESGKFDTSMDVIDQLKHPTVKGIIEDDFGNLWLTGDRGLARFNVSSGQVKTFDKYDGLQTGEFTSAALRTKKGLIYFGGVNGFSVFDPNHLNENKYDPPVHLTKMSLFGKKVEIGEEFNGKVILSGSIISTDQMTLSHKDNVFSFDFSAVDFTAPERIQYKYILEGFDSEWIKTIGEDHTATYMNLPPGNYTFKVNGTNSDGMWSTHQRELDITVLPPWWATWWFRMICIIAVVVGAQRLYKWRTNKLKEEQRILAQKVEEATVEIKAQNASLQEQQGHLEAAIEDTNYVINEAVQSGNFKARINLDNKQGQWKSLGSSINSLFDSVTTPFNTINSIVNHMADGDLTQRYTDEAKGDVLVLKHNFNMALDSLSHLLKDITVQVEVIGASSQEMLHTSIEMNTSTSAIATAISEMSAGAQNQVNRTDQSSSLIEGVMNASSEMGAQAEYINTTANSGVEKSKQGMELVDRAGKSMKSLLDHSQKSNDSIQSLMVRSQEISRVLKLMQDVASQTNLLALNAAIEAASAGESGRGFAVVAEEIRKLAEESKRSTKEIETLIKDIQTDTQSTVTLISEMSVSVAEGEQATTEGAKAFRDMTDSYANTLELSQKIVESTKHQTTAIGNIVSIMEGVVVIAEQTAAGTDEVSSSATELSTGMTTYTEKSKSVSAIVEDLKEKVNRFKL